MKKLFRVGSKEATALKPGGASAVDRLGDRPTQALAFAKRAAKSAKTWPDLHNTHYGIGGKLTELFPDSADRSAFAGTIQFKQITELLGGLPRKSGEEKIGPDEANGRILVRVPRSIHRALLAEAEAEGISMNQLLMAKLSLQLRALV